ncbi:MAG: hypothetical protein ABF535_00215 [Acetobacter sp.]
MLASILLSDEQFFEELVFWDPLESQIANESLTADNYVVWLHAKVRTWGRQIVKAPFGPQPLVLLSATKTAVSGGLSLSSGFRQLS